MITDFFNLAFRNIKHRGLRSWLTMLGIFIGIAAVVSLISLGNGLGAAINAQFNSLSTDRLVFSNAETGFGPPGSTAVRKLDSHDVDVISGVSGIDIIVTRLIRVMKVEYNRIAQFKYVASLPEDQKEADFVYTSTSIKAEYGRLLDAGEHGKIAVGNDFITNNGYEKDVRVGSNLIIENRSFQVVGILAKTSTFTVNSAILMTEYDMNSILNLKDETDLIVLQVKDPNQIEFVADNIRKAIRRDRNLNQGEDDFSVQTPTQALSSVQTILTVINIIITGIATLSLIIGAIGITNTMFTSVLERTKEIGIMKAVGARNSDILSVFLIESGLLGLVGGLVGAIIGLSMAFIASYGANTAFGNQLFTVSPSPVLLIGSILFSLFLGIISGIVPAWQASNLEPVEALRS
jgi:putative ABC transport system permease protein